VQGVGCSLKELATALLKPLAPENYMAPNVFERNNADQKLLDASAWLEDDAPLETAQYQHTTWPKTTALLALLQETIVVNMRQL